MLPLGQPGRHRNQWAGGFAQVSEEAYIHLERLYQNIAHLSLFFTC